MLNRITDRYVMAQMIDSNSELQSAFPGLQRAMVEVARDWPLSYEGTSVDLVNILLSKQVDFRNALIKNTGAVGAIAVLTKADNFAHAGIYMGTIMTPTMELPQAIFTKNGFRGPIEIVDAESLQRDWRLDNRLGFIEP